MKEKWVVLGNQEEKRPKRSLKNTTPAFHYWRNFSCRLNSLVKTRNNKRKTIRIGIVLFIIKPFLSNLGTFSMVILLKYVQRI